MVVKVNLIEELQKLQDKFGYLPENELKKLSKKYDIPGVDIYGVATFYSQFKLKKPAKYIISVCEGTACHVRGSENLLNELKNVLKISPGQTTPDCLFSIEIVRCLGLCASAPVMTVNDKVYSNVTKEKVNKIIEEYKKKG